MRFKMGATTCYIHPNKAANTSCERCHRPICPADHRTVTKRASGMAPVYEKMVVCPECQGILKKEQSSQNIQIMIIGFVFVIAAFAAAYYFLLGGL